MICLRMSIALIAVLKSYVELTVKNKQMKDNGAHGYTEAYQEKPEQNEAKQFWEVGISYYPDETLRTEKEIVYGTKAEAEKYVLDKLRQAKESSAIFRWVDEDFNSNSRTKVSISEAHVKVLQEGETIETSEMIERKQITEFVDWVEENFNRASGSKLWYNRTFDVLPVTTDMLLNKYMNIQERLKQFK